MILILMISIILVIHRIKKGERVMIDKERKSNPIIISGKEDKECYEIIKNYWGEILIRTKIEYGISDISFETWLQKLQIAEYREGTLVLRFPEDEMAALYVKKKYEYPLEYIINEMTVTNIKVLIEGDLTCGKL